MNVDLDLPTDADLRVFDFLVELRGAAVESPATRAGPPPINNLDGFDWDALLLHAARMNLLPLLGWWFYCQGNAVGDVPSWCRAASRLAFSGARFKSQHAVEMARETTAAFREAGVPLAFRKGIHVASLYPRLGCRPFDDVDLLVAHRDLGRAAGLLEDLGFEAVGLSRRQRAFLRLATHNVAVFVRRGEDRDLDIWLDLATSLSLPALRRNHRDHEDIDDALERGTVDSGIAVLDPADLLVDLVTNLYVCTTTLRYVHDLRFRRLSYFVDLLVVAQRLSATQWAQFTTRLRDWGLERAARYAFGNLARLYPDVGSRALAEWCDPAGPELDVVGELELDEPYRWRLPLWQRFTLDAVPADMPPSHAPIMDR